jgi:hypothetical protein
MGASASKEWQGRTTTVEYLLTRVRTGDIIMFAGRGGSSDIIRCTSVTKYWSHVGVVVWVNNQWCITEAYKTVIDRDVLRNAHHAGVQTVDLRKRLQNYDGELAWRPMGANVTRGQVDTFRNMMLSYPDDKVPGYCSTWRLWDLVEYAFRLDDDDNVDEITGREFFVCTSWTARVWQLFGIYRQDLDTGRLLLADVGAANITGILTKGVKPGQLYLIKTM